MAIIRIQDQEKDVYFLPSRKELENLRDKVKLEFPHIQLLFAEDYPDGYHIRIKGYGILRVEGEAPRICLDKETVLLFPEGKPLIVPTVRTHIQRKMWKAQQKPTTLEVQP